MMMMFSLLQKVTADGRNVTRELKRNVVCPAEGPFQNHLRPPHQQISKRVCRDPTALCYQPSPEAALDLWVLQMLGQKDSDSMDPSPSSSSARASSLQTLVHASPSSSSDSCFASHSKSVSTGGQSPQHRSGPSSRSSDLIVSGSSRLSTASDAMIMSSCPSSAFQSPLEEAGFRWPSARPGGGSSTWSPAEAACCLSALHGNQDGPQAGRGPLFQSSSSSPVTNQQWSCGGSLGRPSGRCWVPADPPAAVVFSMSLSPSCSVRTHSFPQGQAFIRRNPEGRWNFTWVPRQGP